MVGHYGTVTNKIVDFLRSGRGEGMSNRQIGERLNVPHGTVNMARRKLERELAEEQEATQERADLAWAAAWAKL